VFVRNGIPISCALAIAVTVAGVKVFRAQAERPSLVWYGNAVHPYISEVRAGVEAFTRDTGQQVSCTVGQEWTQDNQNVNVEALSTLGYRGFSLYPGDPAGANALFKLLRSRGQQVVAFGAEPMLPTPALFTVATDIKASAVLATEHLIQCMGGRGRILNLLEAVTDVNTRKRDEGVREVVARTPGVEIVQTLSDMIQMGEATTKIQSALAARAGELDGMIATGFNPTVAAASILTEWHKDPRHRHIQFVGIDTHPMVLQAIRDGNISATVAQNPFAHGYVSCALLRLLNEGWKPRSEYAFINAGSIVVTKDNLDTYTATLRRTTDVILAELKTKYLLPLK
jgi:ribose transport system substrate-binding protein